MRVLDVASWPLCQMPVNIANYFPGVGDVITDELGFRLFKQRNNLFTAAVTHRFTIRGSFEAHGF